MKEGPILTATDFSEDARPALRAAARLAKRRQVSLTVLHCVEWAADLPSWHGAVSEDDDEIREEGERKVREEFVSAVPESDQPPQVQFQVDVEFPEVAIVDVLDDGDFGLAVLGATGLNRVANFFLGSVPEDVVRRSSVPVLVVPREETVDTDFQQIVAPVDLDPCSRRSLEHAIPFARASDASLTVLHATPAMADIQAAPVPASGDPDEVEQVEQYQAERFHEFLDECDFDGIDWTSRVEVGTPHLTIKETVDELDADLVIMGTHGRRGFERLFLGSTATKTLRTMPCSVMTIRHKESED